MCNEKLMNIENDPAGQQILQFIPNNLGINLCSVQDIIIDRDIENNLVSIQIDFTKADT